MMITVIVQKMGQTSLPPMHAEKEYFIATGTFSFVRERPQRKEKNILTFF